MKWLHRVVVVVGGGGCGGVLLLAVSLFILVREGTSASKGVFPVTADADIANLPENVQALVRANLAGIQLARARFRQRLITLADDPWLIFHGILCEGKDLKLIDPTSGHNVPVLKYIEGGGGQERRLLETNTTQSTVRFRTSRVPMLYEDHFCQFLYVLALSGFGKGTYINTGEGGSSGGLEQVFDTALSDVTQLHDLSWFLPTWCVLGGPSQWTTRFGESVTFDSLVRQHMGNRNEPRCQACRGTHWCLALAYVLKSSEGLLSVESRKAAETTMGQMLRLAATAMDDSGGFRLNWNTSRENQSAEQLLDGRARLGHQGHMLEWVIVSISKEELQDSEWVHRAVEWLLRELEENSDKVKYGEHAHAVRAVKLYHDRYQH